MVLDGDLNVCTHNPSNIKWLVLVASHATSMAKNSKIVNKNKHEIVMKDISITFR